MAFFSLIKNWNIIKLSTNYYGQPISSCPIFLHNTFITNITLASG